MDISSRDLKLLSEAFPDETGERSLSAALARINAGEPLAYLLGEEVFWRYTFKVTPDVLIPRPDTERLVECALKNLPPNGHFADLCTGSGCIAISICGERADVSGIMVDLSSQALAIAEENARAIGVANRLTALRADILNDALPDECFDLIVSNPPYIPTADITDYPSLRFEPQMALDGGVDGLLFYRTIISRYADRLKSDGAFAFEIGFDQREAILSLAQAYGFDCIVTKDYGGNDRVALLRRKQAGEVFV